MRAPRKLHALTGTLLIPAALLAGCGVNPDLRDGSTGSTGQQVAQAQQVATVVSTSAPTIAPTSAPAADAGSVAAADVPMAPTSSTDILPTPEPMPTVMPRPTAVVPPAPEPPVAVAGAGVSIARSSFDSASDLANWTVIDAADYDLHPKRSTWTIANGLLKQAGDEDGGGAQYGTALVTGATSLTDYQVSAAAFSTHNEEAGVVARASDKGYYVFRLLTASGSEPTQIISRYNPTTQQYTDLAQASGVALGTSTWVQLSVKVQGSRIQAFVNGQQVLEATDTTLPQGNAGVYGYAESGLQFDNFAVQALPGS